MEWTRQQQIILLLQCCGLGFFLGMLFDVFNVPNQMRHRRRWLVFLFDVSFFVFSALITFYFSLAIMDGRMHPLLFFGCLIGFCVQHVSLGRVGSVCLYRIGRFVLDFLRVILHLILYPFEWLFRCLKKIFVYINTKILKKVLKRRKISLFFRKKS